jgi:hypothetical protein
MVDSVVCVAGVPVPIQGVLGTVAWLLVTNFGLVETFWFVLFVRGPCALLVRNSPGSL